MAQPRMADLFVGFRDPRLLLRLPQGLRIAHVQMNPHDGQVLVVNTIRDALTHGRVIATYYTPAGNASAGSVLCWRKLAANAVTPAMSAALPENRGLLHGAARTVCRWQAG